MSKMEDKFSFAIEKIKEKVLELYEKRNAVNTDNYSECLQYRNELIEVMSKIHLYFDRVEEALSVDFDPKWVRFSFWRQFAHNDDNDLADTIYGFHKTNVANIMRMTSVSESVAENNSYNTFVLPVLKYIGREEVAKIVAEKIKNTCKVQ